MKYIDSGITLQIDRNKCTGCRVCLDVCPRQVLEIQEKRIAFKEKSRCIECGACQKNCAYDAIHVEVGVGCAKAIFNSIIYGGEPSCDCESSSEKKTNCC